MGSPVDVFMKLFVGDFLKDTADLEPAEVGAYIRLLCHMWNRDGYLLLDHTRLARLAGCDRDSWAAVWPSLAGFFAIDEGRRSITQKRLLRELEQARQAHQAASENGRKGAAARRGGQGTPPPTAITPPPTPVATPPATLQAGLPAPLQATPQANGERPDQRNASSSEPDPEPKPDPEPNPPPDARACDPFSLEAGAGAVFELGSGAVTAGTVTDWNRVTFAPAAGLLVTASPTAGADTWSGHALQPRPPWRSGPSWLEAFRQPWCRKKNALAYGRNADTKAAADLERLLEAFPEHVCKTLWEQRLTIIDRYLIDRDDFVVEAKHSFSVFVSRFSDYLASASATEPGDEECSHHAGGKNSGRPAPPKVRQPSCAECRHINARASPRAASDGPTAVGEMIRGQSAGR